MNKCVVPYWYSVRRNGDVVGIYKGKVVKKPILEDSEGFLMVNLGLTYGNHKQFIHRLVAEKYLDNPNNYEHVLFKDGNIKNVHCNNLEWCP